MKIRVSTVVTTVDDDDGRLLYALQGWQRVFDEHNDCELIVVNDGGPNGVSSEAMKLVTHCGMHSKFLYLDPPSSEFRLAEARNLGIQYARGDRVTFTDSDCIPGIDLPAHHDLGDHKNKITIGFRNRIANPVYTNWGGFIPTNHDLCHAHWRKDERFDEQHDPGWRGCEHVWGCNFGVDRDLLLECGGFDESVIGWGGEDINLADRLMRHKDTELVVTESVVFHLDHPPRTQRSKHPWGARNRPLVVNGGSLGSAVNE